MAAKIDCDNALRRNTATIHNSFANGQISLADAKILYQRELDAYAACRGGVNSLGLIQAEEVISMASNSGQTVFTSAGKFVRTSNGSIVSLNDNAARYNRIVRSCSTCNRA